MTALHTRAMLALLSACGGGERSDRVEPTPPPVTPPADAARTWPELDGFPHTESLATVTLPVRPTLPRFDLGGPVVIGTVVVVTWSQFGALAIDRTTRVIAWSKPTGLRVAPPAALDDGNLAILGDCVNPPEIPGGEILLGCARVVTPAGIDVSNVAIHGPARTLEPFFAARGVQAVWSFEDRDTAGPDVRWRRGDAAIVVDVATGRARPTTDLGAPPLAVFYEARRWGISHDDGRIVASGKHPWATQNRYSALVGAVQLPDTGPMIRIANANAAYDGTPEVHLIDIDATGSLRAQIAKPVPGIAVLATASSPAGDAALAVRLDTSLRRDYIVGYEANAKLHWVHALPERKRVDPILLAWTWEGIVVFHDGDSLTFLPELSASRNPTP